MSASKEMVLANALDIFFLCVAELFSLRDWFKAQIYFIFYQFKSRLIKIWKYCSKMQAIYKTIFPGVSSRVTG